MKSTDLHCRQRMLPEIGPEGQERLRNSTFAPSAHLSAEARELAARYARAAGWGAVKSIREAGASSCASHFRHPAARNVGLAALDVLSASLPFFDIQAPHPNR